jgi:hypothetical protein
MHAVEQNGVDARMRHDRKILALPYCGREVAMRAGGAHAAILTERDWEEPLVTVPVEVRNRGIAARDCRTLNGVRKVRPVLAWNAPDRHRPVDAMRVAADVEIGFEPAEIGQHVVPGPAFGAARRPAVVVAGHAAQRPHAHEAGAAAHHPPLGERTLRGAGDAARAEAAPGVAAIGIRTREGIGDVSRHRARRRILACLDQDHSAGGIFG